MIEPDGIRDQRVMVGGVRLTDPAAVEVAWKEWAGRYGLPVRARDGDRSRDLRESRKKLPAYVSAGSWVADCPCGGGVACWPENPRGCCLDCGTIYRIVFPDPGEVELATVALTARPTVNRHWYPQRGETAQDLREQNIVNGSPAADAPMLTLDALREILTAAPLTAKQEDELRKWGG